MKKLITTVILAAAFIACDSTGKVQRTDKLENNDQKMGYAYGMNVGDQVKNYSENAEEGKELDYAEVERGLLDYLKMNDKKRNSYATGQNIGQSFSTFIENQNLEGVVDMNIMAQGLIDYLKGGETLFSNDSIRPFMDEYIRNRAMAEQQKNLDAGQKFLEDKKKDSKIQITGSGLLYEVIQEGEGESPTIDSQVTVNYIGKTIDGKTFDESKGEPVTFPLGGVIRGWQEGLQLMKPGAKYKFYIPAELAYGQYGSGPIGPNETLIFDVELISFE